MLEPTNVQKLNTVIFILLLLGSNFSIGQSDSLGGSSLYEQVMSVTSSVEDPDKQVGNFDPSTSPSLPIGLVKEINGNKYIIAVDSAYFLNGASYFSAYMAIEFPNSNKKIAFAAKNIQFNPEGAVGGDQAKLMLVSDHLIDLGPNTRLSLKGDGSNYVNWDCNGFKSANLHGAFLLSGNILQPTNEDSVVTAEFEVNVQDIHNMLTSVSFSPFTITGLDDFDFSITEAYADMSDYLNPLDVVMPSCYHEIYPEDIALWRGFYIKNFTVTLPEKLSQADDRTAIYARDMFIDEAGVTGFIGASNVLSLREGNTDGGWGFSIDSLEIGLTTNSLTSGLMAGAMEVPFMDNNAVGYFAAISKNTRTHKTQYNFSIHSEDDVEISCFSSTIELYPTTVLEMLVSEDKFKPKLTLNGKWTLDRPNANFQGIGFQDVTLVSKKPYITAGVFSLLSDGTAKTAKFPVSFTSLSLGIYNEQPVIAATVAINLSGNGEGASDFSAATGFKVITAVTRNESTGKQEWEFDDFLITTIELDIQTQPFNLEGYVNFRREHPIYGDGFEGGLTLSIADVIEDISMFCMFGKLPTYKYWAIDISAPVYIPLGTTGITLTQLSGGLSYHVENTQSAESVINAARGIVSESESMSSDYLPNKEVGIGFRAGVGYMYTSEKILNGEVLFSIQFNENGGLRNILLTGDAYMMVTKAERGNSSNYALGTVAVEFDNQENVLDARLAIRAEFAGAFSADIWAQLYLSPDLWFFHLGTPSDQCSVSLYNFATANAYFMFGQNLPPMPPPPPQVSSVLGGLANGRNEASIASGNGIGTGMSINVGFDASVEWNDFAVYANGGLGIGFDMTLYKYGLSSYCEESGESFGAKQWYLQGQLYAYGGINAGVAGRFAGSPFDITLISASMAMLLQAKIPKPAYVYGGLNMQANLFNLFDLDMTVDFEVGEECTIIN